MPSFASAMAVTMSVAATVLTVTDAAACGKSINMKVVKPGYRLGAVVNYPANEVLDGSFWTEQRIADQMETVDVNSVKTRISSVTSLTDKMDILDISGELTIDLITAGISGTGKAAFLTQSDSSATTAQVIYSTTRKTMSDFVKEELMSELMAFNRFFAVPEATHVVTRVTYGGTVLVSFSEDSESIESRDRLAAELEVSIEKLGLTGSAKLVLDEEQELEFQNIELRVQSDLPLTKTPLTLEDVNEALTGIPEAFERVNGGRGIPLEVTLTPICVWSSDRIGQKVRQITEDAVAEITSVMDAIFSGVASANAVGSKAARAGMPVLKVQAQDFANTLDRFASSVRVRLAQLLPSIRNSLASQVEAITFTSNMRQSPFNYLALRRWMETANEDILEQTRLRKNLLTEAQYPPNHPDGTGWINRYVVLVDSFPQLQRLLVNPDIETAMVLITVNRNSGLSSHLDAMVDYMSNPPLTDDEIKQFPSSFDKAKWLEAPDNAARTRRMTVNMARWAAQTECVLSGCKNVKEGEVLAMMDYNSFIEEFLSMGIKLDRTTVLLYRNGRLVNTDFQLCASPDDPRDDDGRCLWRGEGDIPNGFSCALERPQGGCEGICGLDGRCRNFECSAILEVPGEVPDKEPENDWHKIRLHPEAVQQYVGVGSDVPAGTVGNGLYQDDAVYVDKCLAFTPDTSRGVQIEDCDVLVVTQRWKWGSGLKKAHIQSERETTLCMEAVLYVFDEEDEDQVSNFNPETGTKAPTRQGDPTQNPTKQPTNKPTFAPTGAVEYQDRLADKVYGHIEMRQCSNYNPMQFFQRYTVDFDTPHLMLRPPVVQPFDYQDLCAKFYRLPSGQTGLRLVVCAPDAIEQAVYETSPWRFWTKMTPAGDNSNLDAPLYGFVFNSTINFKAEFPDNAGNHFFWEGSYMRPWFLKGNNAPTVSFYLSAAGSEITVITEDSAESPSPFFKVGEQFQSFSAGKQVVISIRWWNYANANAQNPYGTPFTNLAAFPVQIKSITANTDPSEQAVNRGLLQCPDLCEPLTCADRGKKNAECYTAASQAICTCRDGWGGDNCEQQVDACIDNKCEADEFCTDLLPPAGNTANDRKCQLITACKVNEYLARPSSEVSDSACSPCPAGTVQPEFNITDTVGPEVCVTIQGAAVQLLEELDAKVPEFEDPTTPLARLQTEEALKKACEAKNSHFFPSQGDTIGPRCSYPPCDSDKVPDCSELGCSCIYRVQPAPVVTTTEFGLIMGGSAALGLVGAVAVVVVVDAVLKKVGRS